MKEHDREPSAPSKNPSADRSIPRGTDEHARDDADEAVRPSDVSAAKRASERKTDDSSA